MCRKNRNIMCGFTPGSGACSMIRCCRPSSRSRGQLLLAQVGGKDGHMEEGRHDADDQVGRVDPAEDKRLDHTVIPPSQSTASAAECA